MAGSHTTDTDSENHYYSNYTHDLRITTFEIIHQTDQRRARA